MNNFNKRLNQAIIISKLNEAMDASLAQAIRGRRINVNIRPIFLEYVQHHDVRLLFEAYTTATHSAGRAAKQEFKLPNQPAQPKPPVTQNQQQVTPVQTQQQSNQAKKRPRRTLPQYVDSVKKAMAVGLKTNAEAVIKNIQGDTSLDDVDKRNFIKLIAACYQGLSGAINKWNPRLYDKEKDTAPYDPNKAGLGENVLPPKQPAAAPSQPQASVSK